MGTIEDIRKFLEGVMAPDIKAILARLDSLDKRLEVMERDISQIGADLRQFYRDLGRHDARLDNLEGRHGSAQ